MEIRRATLDDLDVLIKMRIKQLDEECAHPDIDITEEVGNYFKEHLDKDLIQLVLIEDEKIVSTAGIMWMPFPPGFFNTKGTRGYICSVYTEYKYRHRHYATMLMQQLIQLAREYGTTRLLLESSPQGTPVYKKLGFKMHHAMMELKLDQKEEA